jgi:hypothetical protein
VISIIVISKDEPGIDGSLVDIAAQAGALDEPFEIIVVDASEGRLDLIRRRHEPAVFVCRVGISSFSPMPVVGRSRDG